MESNSWSSFIRASKKSWYKLENKTTQWQTHLPESIRYHTEKRCKASTFCQPGNCWGPSICGHACVYEIPFSNPDNPTVFSFVHDSLNTLAQSVPHIAPGLSSRPFTFILHQVYSLLCLNPQSLQLTLRSGYRNHERQQEVPTCSWANWYWYPMWWASKSTTKDNISVCKDRI